MLAKILSCFGGEAISRAGGVGKNLRLASKSGAVPEPSGDITTRGAPPTCSTSGTLDELLDATTRHHQDCRIADDIANACPSALFSSSSMDAMRIDPRDFIACMQRHLFPVFLQEHALTVSRVSRAVRRLPGYAQIMYNRTTARQKVIPFAPSHQEQTLLSTMLLHGLCHHSKDIVTGCKAKGMTAVAVESAVAGARQNLSEEVVASLLAHTPGMRRLGLQFLRKTRGAVAKRKRCDITQSARQRRRIAAAQWKSVSSRRPFRWAKKTPEGSNTPAKGFERSPTTSLGDKRKAKMFVVECSTAASQGGVVYAKSSEYRCRAFSACHDVKALAEMFDPRARQMDREQYDVFVPPIRDFVIKCVENSTFSSSAYRREWRQRLISDVVGRERQHMRLRLWREATMMQLIAYLEMQFTERTLLAEWRHIGAQTVACDAKGPLGPLFLSFHHFLPAMEENGALWDVFPSVRWRRAYAPSPRSLFAHCTSEEIGRVMASPLSCGEQLACERTYFPSSSERSSSTLSELLGKPAQDVYRTWASPLLRFSHIAHKSNTEPQTTESRNSLQQSCLAAHADTYRDLLQIHSLRVAENYIPPESIDYSPHLEIIQKHFDDKRLRQTDVEPSRRIDRGEQSFVASLRNLRSERSAAGPTDVVKEERRQEATEVDMVPQCGGVNNESSKEHTEVVLGDSGEYALLLQKLRLKHPHPTKSTTALGKTLHHLQQSPRVLFIKKHFAETVAKLNASGLADDVHSLHYRTARLLAEEYSTTALIGKSLRPDAAERRGVSAASTQENSTLWANDPLLSALSQQANLLMESRNEFTERIASFEERLGQLKMSQCEQ